MSANNVVIGRTEADDDSDRFAVLDNVLDRSGFWERLEEKVEASGKSKAAFLVAIKPNLMMFYSQSDMSVITEPALVEHLCSRLPERGYSNVALVESQNVYGNWFKNRGVETVAKYAGYDLSSEDYHLVDLTLDTVAHEYEGDLGMYLVGKTWRDADFRVSFAKNKTHFSTKFTLTIKNIYGTTPEQNKFREYHRDREVDHVTVEMLKEFPVHFGIVDGVWSSDGLLGIKSDLSPKHTQVIYAGDNLVAVDMVGGRMMGVDPMQSSFVRLAAQELGTPDFDVIGDDSRHENWDNVPPGIEHVLNFGEEYYGISNLLGLLSSEMDPVFPLKTSSKITIWVRQLVLKVLQTISRYE